MSAAPPASGNLFPYRLYLSDSAARDEALSWRLTDESGEEPRAWIHVLSTGVHRQFRNDSLLATISKTVGRKLSEQLFGLMTGGWEGVDEATGIAYTRAFDKSYRDIRHYQRIYSRKGMSLHDELKSNSTLLTLETRHLTLQSMTNECDACILIGGTDGTSETAQMCLKNGLPVLPIVESGSAAESFFTKEIMKMDAANRMEIYGEDFEPEQLQINYKDAIDSIMRYLENRFPLPHSTQAP